jgi:hypothetical protein
MLKSRSCILSLGFAAMIAAPAWCADSAAPQSDAATPAAPATSATPASPAQSAAPPATTQPEAAAQSTSPVGAHSYFINLHDGQIVTSPFKVVFGLGPEMGVAPSGVEKANAGHHHLLIDTKLTPEQMTQAITVDEHHVHFRQGTDRDHGDAASGQAHAAARAR